MFSFFCSSVEDGNCWFSSASIVLVGDSSLSSVLRAQTCLELYSNSDFYLNYPIYNILLESNTDKCQLITNKKGNFTITIKNEVVSNSGTAKILGVTFDSALSFEPQYQTNLPHWKFQIKCDCENEPIS